MHQGTRKWTSWIGAAAVVTAAALLAAGCTSSGKTAQTMASTNTVAPSASDTSAAPTIVVAGHGEVSGTPDTMTMSIGVSTTDASAQNALDRNSREANALEATLQAKGVAKKDMQTTDLSINQNYDKNGNVTGYRVSNMVTVTLHDLTSAGDVIDAGAAAAGNDITFNGIQLSIADTSALLRNAREDAVKQAIAHAQQLAAAAGVTLGSVVKIDDTGSAVPQPFQYAAGDAASARAAEPIQAGSQQVSVDVTVTFAVKGS